MSIDDGHDYVHMVYDRGRVRIQSRIDGQTASSAMSPEYNRNWP